MSSVLVDVPAFPPAAWFADPELRGPTALTVDDSGRVRGHGFLWDSTHAGIPGQRPPREPDYRLFNTGAVKTSDGSMVATGRLSLGGGHAGTEGSVQAALAHYDDVATAVADCTVGSDRHGLWMAGSIRPGVTQQQLRVLRASSVSGDWRSVGGRLRLVAIAAVNVPGFAVPRSEFALAASGAAQTVLIPGQRVRPTAAALSRARRAEALIASVGPLETPAERQAALDRERQHRNTIWDLARWGRDRDFPPLVGSPR